MNTADASSAGADAPHSADTGAVSRREFVARLRRAALFVAPVVAAVALEPPKAMAVCV
jgi:hypothetical protein